MLCLPVAENGLLVRKLDDPFGCRKVLAIEKKGLAVVAGVLCLQWQLFRDVSLRAILNAFLIEQLRTVQ